MKKFIFALVILCIGCMNIGLVTVAIAIQSFWDSTRMCLFGISLGLIAYGFYTAYNIIKAEEPPPEDGTHEENGE